MHDGAGIEMVDYEGSAMAYEGFIQSCFQVDFDGLWSGCSRVGAGGAITELARGTDW